MSDFWTDEDYYTGPPLTDDMIAEAERTLGYKLPQAYLELLRVRNGGTPKRACFPTQGAHAGAQEHIQLSGIRGIGGIRGIDAIDLADPQSIAAWGYPNIGFVVAECSSAGHDVVMLDYSDSGPEGEPRVVRVAPEHEELQVLTLAESFQEFIAGLVDERAVYENKP